MNRALADLRAGDTLVVWKLDQLGSSLCNLLESPRWLHERDVVLQSLTKHIDTATALTPTQVREAKSMIERGESTNQVARVLRVGRSTLYRAIR